MKTKTISVVLKCIIKYIITSVKRDYLRRIPNTKAVALISPFFCLSSTEPHRHSCSRLNFIRSSFPVFLNTVESFFLKHKSLASLETMSSTFCVMHQSILALPIPPGQPPGICTFFFFKLTIPGDRAGKAWQCPAPGQKKDDKCPAPGHTGSFIECILDLQTSITLASLYKSYSSYPNF